jgi:hypothetical protein
MRYTVGWLPSAEVELARIWIAATDRQAVSRAADQIEILLRISSQARGGDEEGIRSFSFLPLAVIFEVSPDDRKVTILEVYRVP